MHPEFDRAAVLGWLLARGKIEVPARTPAGALLMARPGGGTRTVRLDHPLLNLAEDASGEDRLTAWSTDADADTLAALTDAESGGTLRRLTVPGGVRFLDRVRTGAGGLKQGHVPVELTGGPPDGLLLDVTGWDPQEIVDNAVLMSDHGRFGPGGRSDYEPADGGSGDVGRFVWRGEVP
ncbi:hypothetical protein [Streptomyces lavendulae]|uniref:hypothetical protein n=1 Tax=Streptomyces lavendulae TaxID=1914 RepID=UPI0036A68907